MLKNRLLWAVVVLLFSIGISGCGTYKEASQKQILENRLKAYGKTARWGALENLYAFLTPEEGAKAEIPADLENIQVTDYAVRVPVGMVEPGKASQTAEIYYLFRDRNVVRSLVDKQLWEFNETDNTWYRTNPVPEFN